MISSLNPLLSSVFMLQWNGERFMVEWEGSLPPCYTYLISFGSDLRVHAAKYLHLTPWPKWPFLWFYCIYHLCPFLCNSCICIHLHQCVYISPSFIVSTAFLVSSYWTVVAQQFVCFVLDFLPVRILSIQITKNCDQFVSTLPETLSRHLSTSQHLHL